jgi:hypothetical protein
MHAPDPGGVQVSLDGEGMHDLARAHAHLAQVDGVPVGRALARFLLELAARCGEKILSVIEGTLGERPGAHVATSPDRAAWMGDQDLDLIPSTTVEEQTG